jgi:hypothetical protein
MGWSAFYSNTTNVVERELVTSNDKPRMSNHQRSNSRRELVTSSSTKVLRLTPTEVFAHAAGLSALHGLRVTFDEHTAALSAIGV